MKTFNLINLLTKQLVTVEAETLSIASKEAVLIAIDLDADHLDNHSAYWIKQRDYHNTEGYTVLSVEPKDMAKEEPEATPFECATLQQHKERMQVFIDRREELKQLIGDSANYESLNKLKGALRETEEEISAYAVSITNFIMGN